MAQDAGEARADDAKPGGGLLAQHGCSGGDQRLLTEGNPNVGRIAAKGIAEEAGRSEGFSDDRGVGTIGRFPGVMTEDDDGSGAGVIVGRCEDTSGEGADARGNEVILLALPVSVTYQEQGSNGLTVEAASAAPGIFTQTSSGVGPGAILNQDYTLNGPANPAARGSTVTIFMTGEGQTSPSGVDGWVTVTSSVGPITPGPVLPVSATLADQPAFVQFAGEAPGIVSGVLQVNLQIPANAPTGNLAIVVSIGNIKSQAGVTVSVQ